jgi:uncharacterized protein YndB with AHSA1/START domain
MNSPDSRKPKFVYVIYIASTPDKVFAALTDADMTERYWHGSRLVSDWTIGATVSMKIKNQTKNITGVVLECDPPRRLAYSFEPHHSGMDGEAPSRVTFKLERQGDQVKLTIVHDGFEPGSKVFEAISRGWPLILSSLKSYLEAGKVLQPDWYREEASTAEGGAS